MANFVTSFARQLIAKGSIPWDDGGTTYKCALAGAAFVPTGAEQYMDDLSDELTDPSYTRGTVAGRAVSATGECTANNQVFAGLTSATAVAWAVVCKWVTNDADSPIVAICEAVSACNGTDFTVDWDGAGIVYSLDAP